MCWLSAGCPTCKDLEAFNRLPASHTPTKYLSCLSSISEFQLGAQQRLRRGVLQQVERSTVDGFVHHLVTDLDRASTGGERGFEAGHDAARFFQLCFGGAVAGVDGVEEFG